MPIYNFKCDKCNLRFEKIYTKIKENKKEECPNCGNLSERLIANKVNFSLKESTHIPKEIDHKIGSDSEKRWEEYEKKNNLKEKIRKETGSRRLSRDLDGNYTPLTVTKDDGDAVTEKEAIDARKKMFNILGEVKHNPKSQKFTPEE